MRERGRERGGKTGGGQTSVREEKGWGVLYDGPRMPCQQKPPKNLVYFLQGNYVSSFESWGVHNDLFFGVWGASSSYIITSWRGVLQNGFHSLLKP